MVSYKPCNSPADFRIDPSQAPVLELWCGPECSGHQRDADWPQGQTESANADAFLQDRHFASCEVVVTDAEA